MYFSVFVYMIPKQTFIQCKSFRTEFHIENDKSCSLGQVAHACAIENHMSENAIFEPVDFSGALAREARLRSTMGKKMW